MSRIGKLPVAIPAGVTVTVSDDNLVTVKGPKGTLAQKITGDLKVKSEAGFVTLTCESRAKEDNAKHGLYRVLIHNMVTGVTEGFTKTLEIEGVGYRAAMKGKNLGLNLGYSHPIEVVPPKGITFEVEGATKIFVKGADK